MIPAFHSLPPGFPPPPGRRRSALDRPPRLSLRQRCWWAGHRWDYRMSTQRVIIEFRQCLRCGQVEILVGCAG
ncbi:MAG TPA: hypothetical protein VGX49_05190 [Jatrophihabitans sp.]|nr:hypothetical protein [Jatrophihabitans sp.]